jgi:hypothetical protein
MFNVLSTKTKRTVNGKLFILAAMLLISHICNAQYNTNFGNFSFENNFTGNYDCAFGHYCMNANVTGSTNTANGSFSLRSNISGGSNTAFGYAALYANTTGSNNTALGDSAGYSSLGSGNLFIGNKSGYNELGNDKFYLANNISNVLIYGDFFTHQVLLGNASPGGYVFKGNRTLNVIGGILTDSIHVALVGNWADHVLEPDYKLKTLSELKNYITINKHLPGIPSAKEVLDNGINLANMDAKLLEKIEELHLYILEQQKEIDELRKIIYEKK